MFFIDNNTMFIPDDGPYYDFYSTGQLKVEGFMENGYCKYHNIYTKYGTLEKEYIYDEDSSYVLKSYYSNGKNRTHINNKVFK